MAVNKKSLENLNKYKMKSAKVLDAPLAKKQLHISLEQPVQDVLDSLDSKDRLTLVRRAIAKELIAEGLLTIPTGGER